SDGWQWNEKMMSAYRGLAPDQNTAVTVMGNQDDFNYGAYTTRGVPVWAQAYGATLDAQYDPSEITNVLLRNGVPQDMAQPVLGAGGYAAIWRSLSGQLAEPARQAGFLDPGYWLRMAAEHRIAAPPSGTDA